MKRFLILLFLFSSFCLPQTTLSQIIMTPENVGLGGGGTAYLTGYEALFINPANLYIQEKSYSYQISFLQGTAYFDSPLQRSNRQKLSDYLNSSAPYSGQPPARVLAEDNRANLLARNYPNNRLVSTFQTRSEMHWFGIKWTDEEKSFAASLRSRSASRYRTGRGLFSRETIEIDGIGILDQSFSHQYQVLHELSFGYAESFTFLNGLIPQLSQFIVGIAPKLVLPGAYLDVDHTQVYNVRNNSGEWIRETGYRQTSAGYLTASSHEFIQNQQITPGSFDEVLFGELLKPTGIGFGLDAGITYLITFGDDLSVLRRADSPTEKSLRLSFSVKDLGAVYHFRSPALFEADRTITDETGPRPLSDSYYMGAPNEHLFFLNQQSDHPLLDASLNSEKTFESFLPTSIQAGALFQVRRLKLVGDLSYSLSQTAFSGKGLKSYIGGEVQPLEFLSLQAGTRIAQGLPGYISFGVGIDTKRLELNSSLMLRSGVAGTAGEISGISTIGFRVFMP